MWLLTVPPCSTRHFISFPVVSITRSVILPSSISTLSSAFSSRGKSLYVTAEILLFPSTSSMVRVKICPSLSSALPPSKFPVLISGPLVSSITAAGTPRASLTFLKVSMVLPCPSWVPCEKLSLATFMPALSIFSITASSDDAGPNVHTILVFRIGTVLLFIVQLYF